MAVVRGGMTPQIEPETAKILAVTIEKDNDNKFRYLSPLPALSRSACLPVNARRIYSRQNRPPTI